MGDDRGKGHSAREDIPCISVRIESGQRTGERYTFRKTCITLGRGVQNDVTLASDSAVSNQHALLTWRDGHWEIEDRGSKNGTYLATGAERIRLTGPHRLDTSEN